MVLLLPSLPARRVRSSLLMCPLTLACPSLAISPSQWAPCSTQSLLERLQSPYYNWSLALASLPGNPPNLRGVQIIVNHSGLILGEGGVKGLVPRPLRHNSFLCSVLYLTSLSHPQSRSCFVLFCFVSSLLPIEGKRKILVRHVDS